MNAAMVAQRIGERRARIAAARRELLEVRGWHRAHPEARHIQARIEDAIEMALLRFDIEDAGAAADLQALQEIGHRWSAAA